MRFNEPYPFRFNPFKHHLGWICNHLLKSKANNTEKSFLTDIKELNNNYIDIYTGALFPFDILNFIKKKLIEMDVIAKADFKLWIRQKDYKIVKISDDSEWVLRYSIENSHFIHVHPARNTFNSMRFQGAAFKTALILYLFFEKPENSDLLCINRIRTRNLDLSPLKTIKSDAKIFEALGIIDFYCKTNNGS